MSTPSMSPISSAGPGGAADSTRPGSAWWHRLAALLVVVTAVPAAVLAVPNTMSYVVAQAVSDLGMPPAQAAALVRANGLALPALLLAVPLGAVLARRFAASAVLIAGIAVLLAGELAAELVGEVSLLGAVPMVGALRLLEGLGAGAVLPASLVLAWRHYGAVGRALAAAWAGALGAALIVAMPLALYGMPAPGGAGGEWRAALQPYPWLAVAALGVAVLCGLLPRPEGVPALRHTERTQLLLPLAPAAGFAFLAVVTTYGWSPSAQLLVAGLGLAGLLGLALVGSRDATAGSPLGFAIVALTAGVVGMPVAAPLAGLLTMHPGPGGVPLVPFAGAAAAALIGALIASRLGSPVARAAVLAGHGLALVAVLVLFVMDPVPGGAAGPWPILVPLALLGAGFGLALAASLRAAGLGSALFGLTLCFPAVLSGYMVIGPMQVHKVNGVLSDGGRADDVGYALAAAFRGWLIVAGVITVLMAGAVAVAWRRRGQPAGEHSAGG